MDTQAMHAWQFLYPPLQRHEHGWLDVGDGHAVYWEASGNPLGMPALFVHGGPGAGCSADDRRWFDPRLYRIVLFDQRGAGRSRPLGRLIGNDTAHLLADIDALRRHLQVERWLLFGGSWGATLAIAYAQRHPERVRALVLRGVYTATAAERRWLYSAQGAARLQPAAWTRLRAALSDSLRANSATHSSTTSAADSSPDFEAEPGADLLAAFAARLHCGEAAVAQTAAQAWLQWEHDLMDSEMPQAHPSKPARPRDDDAALAMARIGVHYARHAFFLDEGQLLAQAGRLHGLPGVIVQGLRDQVTPPAAARALHRAWPGATLQCVDAAGHASSHPAIAQKLIAATDQYGVADDMTRRAAAAAGRGADDAGRDAVRSPGPLAREPRPSRAPHSRATTRPARSADIHSRRQQ